MQFVSDQKSQESKFTQGRKRYERKMAKQISRENYDSLIERIENLEDSVARNVKNIENVFDRTDSLKNEQIEQRRTQIDISRQNYKTCVVLSGKDVVLWKNEKKAFIHLAKKAFGVSVGYFDIQVTIIDNLLATIPKFIDLYFIDRSLSRKSIQRCTEKVDREIQKDGQRLCILVRT